MKIGIISDAINDENITGIGVYTRNVLKKCSEISNYNRYFSINYLDINMLNTETRDNQLSSGEKAKAYVIMVKLSK